MTTFLYLLIAALIFGVIGYILASINCSKGERYLTSTPTDPVTKDDGSCEDADAKAAKEAEAQRLLDEAAAKTKAEEEAATLAAAATAKAAQEKADKEKAEAEAKAKAEKAAATAEEEVPSGAAPEGLLSAPRGGKKDNLTRIKGVGVKIDEALNGIGIYHFDQIAAWTEENMAWADAALAFPGRAKRDDWVGQAKLLSQGKETEFSQRVDKGEVASSKKG